MCAIEYYTYDDYVHWEGKWELIDGIAYAMAPSPMITHQALAMQVAFELERSIENCDKCLVVAEEDWKISDDTVLKPDVSLICDEPNEAYITKTPEIVVEIISKSSSKRDEKYKFKIYESEKVPYYILVYPDDLKAKIYKLKDGKFDKEGDFFDQVYKFEGLSCSVDINFSKVFKKFKKK
ncbi:Uma2 family endonuclease [Hydrogenimonas thermophila]|uniref:Putative restriction endonuclease n=1 Tax=Hydrogenimonas thermophila TaxID=223786 RepID=A0A1I5MWU5_9BACT|nr:Uma2 family endonuclease [Hydrogenimonas thermophila]SFP13952.1 Putative restriction endonuclease [Hydrogenimonas thermophila]